MKSEENKATLEYAAPFAASLFEQVLNGYIDRATETFGNLEKFTQKSRKNS